MVRGILMVVLAAVSATAGAITFALPPADVDVVGRVRFVEAGANETLLDIGRRNGLGYEEMRIANPDVDIWLPGTNTLIVLPTRFILPDAPREGIVLNVAEMRLYYYPETKKGEQPVVETYPVAIGRQDWSTPLGATRITQKVKDPWWYPPESIKEEARANGQTVPDAVPPGPDNPMGQFKMRLGIPGYLIHGTNRPWGVGMRVTHGCVRMFPEDIERLFGVAAVNTPVRIVNQPVKAGWAAGRLYVEVHPVLDEERARGRSVFEPAVGAVNAAASRGNARVDHASLEAALTTPTGVPVEINRASSISALGVGRRKLAVNP